MIRHLDVRFQIRRASRIRLASIPMRLAAPALALILAACESADDQAIASASSSTRDSAGVRIVQLRGEDRAPVGRVSIPTKTIGGQGERAGEGLALYLVEGVQRLGDSAIVIANRGSSELIVADNAGRRRHAIGRNGSGPGEFRRLVSLFQLGGDTLAAFDGQLRKIAVFASDGTFVRQYDVQTPRGVSSSGLAEAVGTVGEGRAVVWVQALLDDKEVERLNRPNAVGHVRRVVFTIDSVGRTLAVIGEFAGPENYLGEMVAPSGEATVANWGPAPFGNWIGFGTFGNRVYVFESAQRGYAVHTPDGERSIIFRGNWPVRRVTSEARRIHLEEWVRRFPAWLTPEERRAEFEKVRYPEVMPSYRDAIVGSDGIVWIEPYALWDGERRHYIGYDSSGVAVGKLSFDYNDRILEIGGGAVVLVHVLEHGAEAVHLTTYHF